MVAERFAVGEPSLAIAKELRVSVRLVQRWRRAWDRGGPGALRSAGPASLPRLPEAQLFVLETELAKERPTRLAGSAADAGQTQRAPEPTKNRPAPRSCGQRHPRPETASSKTS
ncbi:helix-turn-helix domain-containing protein [Streptomyces sp. EWL5.16]